MKKNTLVRLCKDSFVRNYQTHGYITNQMIKNDRIYNETGADFLSVINRLPETLESKVNKLLDMYQDIEFNELSEDFIRFVIQLELEGFVLTGESVEEIDNKEPIFTFSEVEVKTNKRFFSEDHTSEGTSEYVYDNLIHEHQLSSLTIELTKRCNERCVHCYLPNEQKTNGKTLSLDKVKELLDEGYDMGLLQVTFTGGEPFLHPHFENILRYARQKDMMISILSNLTLIKEKHIPLLKEVNLSMIQVSLYSMDAATHDLITQLPGSYKMTMNAIRLLLSNDIPVTISCPVMNVNYNHFKDVLIWARKHRISASTDLDLSAQTDYNASNLNYSTNRDQNRELLGDMLMEDKDWQKELLEGYAQGIKTKDDLNQPPCSVGNDSMFISCEGIAYPCPSWQSFPIADLNITALKDAWSDENNQIMRLRKIKRQDFPEFVNSEYREFMNVCMARNANNNNGDYMKMDPKNIEVAKMTKELVDEFVEQNKH